jgi:multimeric flavodoxin WrbA
MSKTILIVVAGHDPINGSTSTLAKYFQTGVQNAGHVGTIMSASAATAAQFVAADGYILGTGDYNGNPEPDMINFLDTTLGAGKSGLISIAAKPFAVFCTSGGYATGAQSVLNSVARSMMTFGGIYVGGGGWHVSQGVCGMVKDKSSHSPAGFPAWCWVDSGKGDTQAYLYDDACQYGYRLAKVAAILANSASQLTPTSGTMCPQDAAQACPTSSSSSSSLYEGYDRSNKEKADNKKMWIIIGSVLGGLIFFGLLYTFYLMFSRKGKGGKRR